jgi:hypothetical protein
VSECPYRVGQRVRLVDPHRLADDLWQYASGPADPNATLAVALAALWPDDKPLARVLSVAPDGNGWYLVVQASTLDGGDEFGLAATDVEPVGVRLERANRSQT